MKKALCIVCSVFLTSCSTITPPSSYSITTPSKQIKSLYHETIGLVESHKRSNSIAFAPQLLKPLTKNILSSTHGPVQIQKSKQSKTLFTKNEGHAKHVKLYLPIRLKTAIFNLKSKSSFTAEVITTRGKQIYECTRLKILDHLPNTELIEIHLFLDDEQSPLTPSETLQIKLPIGKKEQVLIPQKALQKSHFSPFVYIVNKKGHLEKRKVKLGHEHGDQIAIVEGLGDRDKIAVSH